MTAESSISIISLGLSVIAVSVSVYTLWARSRVTGLLPLSTSPKNKEPKEAELESGMSEWPGWSCREAAESLRRPKDDGSLPGDPTFNVRAESG